MPEALEHSWLAATSSVSGESQINRLGGDSVWEIESFEDRSEVDEEDERYVGPLTASGTGTNLESDASGSFSQPFDNLQLATPTKRPNDTPPSPPLTAERDTKRRPVSESLEERPRKSLKT
jgi:hypothetical protein